MAMRGIAVVGLAWLFFRLASAELDPSEQVGAKALADDDECAAGDLSEQCSLTALQLRGVKQQHHKDAVATVSEEKQREIAEAWAAHRAWQKERREKEPTGHWFGGGRVDSLNGQDQVDIMTARDKDWQIGPVVYQVYVDRFVPPKKSMEELRELHPPPQTVHPWSEGVTKNHQLNSTKYWSGELSFWGGDLQGVISQLDYIKSMGDVLYLQPIFEAYSNHKYDTSDYMNIDPAYGTIEDFDELVKGVHDRGMHLVLDGVFNHVGVKSKLFQEAMSNPDSPARHWFFIGEEYGALGYKAWQGGGTLAEWRLEDNNLRNYLWKNSTSVVAKWLKRGADGFRLDVGTEIGREFLWDLTKAAHRHKYSSLVVGEVSAYPRWWTEAMDGVLSFWMGWVISGVATGQMGGIFAGLQIEQLIEDSSMEQVLRSWIIVSNHDIDRLATKYPDPAVRRFAQTLQFVLPGAVCIYYGDELGMPGDKDRNREPMKWGWMNETNEQFNVTRTLVNMRRYHRALRIGDFTVMRSFSLLAFMRRTDRIADMIIVLANPLPKPIQEQLVVPEEDLLEYTLFRDTFSGAEARIHGGTIEAKIPPRTVRVFHMVDEKGPSGEQYKRIYGHFDTFPSVNPLGSLGNSVGEIV
mmetsp:Transcript_97250/g.280635  ORF Transcript_97250/g.280635 Transcript_97250/m.280635 type:complete len:635 (-) Transcript_97250:67-1971(-)